MNLYGIVWIAADCNLLLLVFEIQIKLPNKRLVSTLISVVIYRIVA